MKFFLSFKKPYRLLLGLLAAALAGLLLWSVIPRPIVKDPGEIRDIRIEYNGEYVTDFDQARAAELLSQVTARRSLSNRTSYRCVVEVSFYYGDNYRPYHMVLGQGSDFCYGLGLKTYHICSPQAVLEGFEALLLEK